MTAKLQMLGALAATCLLLSAGGQSADTVGDAQALVHLEAPDDWLQIPPPTLPEYIRSLNNSNLHLLGFDPDETILVLINTARARDIIPVLTVEALPAAGVALNQEELDLIKERIEKDYGDRLGGDFRLLTLVQTFLNGIRCARLTGIYRWRTNNIKILQYIVPGSERTYVITYTAKERQFRQFLDEVETALATLSVADRPLELGWLGELLRLLVLLGIVGGIVWLIFSASSIRPGGTILGRLLRPGGSSSSANPFERRR